VLKKSDRRQQNPNNRQRAGASGIRLVGEPVAGGTVLAGRLIEPGIRAVARGIRRG
jgi:hypothetical protein